MTLSNRLTFVRLCMSPLIFLVTWFDLSHPGLSWQWAVNGFLVMVATFSEISDALDGKLARDRGQVTDFGKLFDPFADYVYRFTFFFCFWWMQLAPAWMVVLLFYRETAISFLRLVVRGENIVLSARKSGKIKAVSQAIAIFVILLGRLITDLMPAFPLAEVSWWTMLLVVIVTLYSMVDYIWAHRDIIGQIHA